jgi:hypothetical protein
MLKLQCRWHKEKLEAKQKTVHFYYLKVMSERYRLLQTGSQ